MNQYMITVKNRSNWSFKKIQDLLDDVGLMIISGCTCDNFSIMPIVSLMNHYNDPVEKKTKFDLYL